MARRVSRSLPSTYQEFVNAFPAVGRAWEALGAAARGAGPMEGKTAELVKLGIAIGARSEGAVHSAVRKARAAGASPAELYQSVCLAASTIGVPNAVAAYTWLRDELGTPGRGAARRKRRR